ncbi:MAG: hypothetical protein V1862_06075, partial [Methanobacteriota archaeon]
ADGSSTIDMYLNPVTSIADLKRELLEKGVMEEGEAIICNDLVPGDDQRISDLSLEDGATILIRGDDGE